MYKVGIIGPESTGKSDLARYLSKRYGGVLVEEYARRYVEEKGTTEVSYEKLCEIARRQIEEIKAVSYQLSDISFFDTELIVTKVWFEYAFGRVPEWLNEAIKAYPMDVYLLTYPDIAWVPDPARSNGSDEIREDLIARHDSEIQALEIAYYIIRHEDND